MAGARNYTNCHEFVESGDLSEQSDRKACLGKLGLQASPALSVLPVHLQRYLQVTSRSNHLRHNQLPHFAEPELLHLQDELVMDLQQDAARHGAAPIMGAQKLQAAVDANHGSLHKVSRRGLAGRVHRLPLRMGAF